MRTGVVLDKNYLQGAKRAHVAQLAVARDLVMPGALFYELLTTSAKERRMCFLKLPQTENPVILVDHIGILLAREIDRGQPSGRPSQYRVDMRFEFNKKLQTFDYDLPSDAKKAVDQQTIDATSDANRLIDLSEEAPSLFPGLLSSSARERDQAKVDAEAAIGDLETVRTFYSTLEHPDSTKTYPLVSGDLSQWALIRWLQVLMLVALDLHVRYQGRLRERLAPGTRERLEHDVHDAQILCMGVLEGAIATNEKKLLRWFPLLTPTGAAIPL